jgi:hypothetical protein
MKYNEIIKECRELAKTQNIEFKRSKTISTINNKACYELESGIQQKTLQTGSLMTVWNTLLSESLANQ